MIAETVDTKVSRAPRNIYLDLGAFQGDTLQMFQLHGILARCHPDVAWEIFAFEACPLLAHSTQLHVDKLNNLSVDAPISYRDIPSMQRCVERVYEGTLPFNNQLKLLFEKYEQILISRNSSQGAYEDQFQIGIEEAKIQLQEAAYPSCSLEPTYTAYAMAVGHEDTTLEMNWHYTNYINGGGNLTGIDYGRPTHVFAVPVIKHLVG